MFLPSINSRRVTYRCVRGRATAGGLLMICPAAMTHPAASSHFKVSHEKPAQPMRVERCLLVCLGFLSSVTSNPLTPELFSASHPYLSPICFKAHTHTYRARARAHTSISALLGCVVFVTSLHPTTLRFVFRSVLFLCSQSAFLKTTTKP